MKEMYQYKQLQLDTTLNWGHWLIKLGLCVHMYMCDVCTLMKEMYQYKQLQLDTTLNLGHWLIKLGLCIHVHYIISIAVM